MCFHRVILIAIATVLGTTPATVPAQSPAPTTEMEEAARRRQESIKTVDVEFTRKEIIAPGGMSGLMPGMVKDKGKVTPEKEVRVESSNRVVFKGNKLRYENNHPIWSPEKGATVPTRLVNVCDGEVNKNLYSPGLNGPDIPEGYISDAPRSNDIKSRALVPLVLTLRGLEPALSPYTVPDFKPTGASLPIDGAICQEYVFQNATGQSVRCSVETLGVVGASNRA